MRNRSWSLGLASLLTAAALCTALVGCRVSVGNPKGSPPAPAASSKITKENFDKVKNDMTKQQIVEILGEPTETKAGAADARSLIWRNGMNFIQIDLGKEGKVESKTNLFVK